MRTLALLFLYVLIALIASPVVLVCRLFHWLKPVVFMGVSAVRLGRVILGIKLEVTGLEQIDPDTTYVIMPNHLSLVDGPLMFIIYPRFMRVIAKEELFRVPILAQAMRVAEFIPVDRKGKEAGKKAIERAVQLIREKRQSFLIFPEGTRSRDGQLQKFRRGGFYLALQSETPILPVSIVGSYELMSKGALFAKRGTIKVAFHSPIAISGYDEASMSRLIETVRSAIACGIAGMSNPSLVLNESVPNKGEGYGSSEGH
jgi:1-acyl-sn-glycerol-3-phosphate acyltransferase